MQELEGPGVVPEANASIESVDRDQSALTRRTLLQAAGAVAVVAAAGGGAPQEALAEQSDRFTAWRQSGHFGPRQIKNLETVWVTMRDEVKLAVRIILPVDAERDPVPAVMTYQPYRRRDLSRGWEERAYYLASHGYAAVMPDIRGSGDSEGLTKDEYLQAQTDDGMEVIAWLATQPWCTGKVGMIGLSWAGFTSLQVAFNRPPALKAIITSGFTDNRYTDDAHYLGGTIVQDMFLWGSDFFTLLGLPPDPAVVGSRWRRMWKERCEAIEFPVATWLKHQTYDAYWKHGSVCENYGAIQCPVYAVDGWTDGYTNSVPRVMEHLSVPRKALIGPWAHEWGDVAQPGPNIDWPDEERRWWDHWLKGIDTGIMSEPAYRAWMAESPVHHGMTEMPGRWVAEETWPSPRITTQTWHLNNRTLGASAEESAVLVLEPTRQTVGIDSGHWCPGGGGENLATELALDQGTDDGRSLLFDSAPLEKRIEILGFPIVELDLAVDKPVALIAVRLNEVHPGGISRRVSYGVLNLTHREGHEHPLPLEPGKRYRVRVQLKNSGFAFKPGNRIRVSVSAANWYLVLPPPQPVNLTVFTGTSTLLLPVRPPRPEDAQLRPFGAPFELPKMSVTVIKPDMPETKKFTRNVGLSSMTVTSEGGGGVMRLNETGTVLSNGWRNAWFIEDADPSSARVTCEQSWEFSRGRSWQTRVETRFEVTLTQQRYELRATCTAFDREKPFFTRSWKESVPRLLS
jgi:uncharacterized protein